MKNFDLIKQSVTSDVSCLIWVTSESLKDYPKGIREVDYLLDGLLEKFLKNDLPDQPHSIFYGRSFGRAFTVIHIRDQGQNLEKEARQVVEIIKDDSLRKAVIIDAPKIKNLGKMVEEITHINMV